MPLVAAAVCPHPPVIVPELAGTAAPELDDLRAACGSALEFLLAAGPDAVLVVGGGQRTEGLRHPYWGTFRPWGSPVGFELGGRQGEPVTPLSLVVGGWLLARHDLAERTLMFETVDVTAPTGECVTLGADLAGRRPRVALLVMGDGSACQGDKSPGYDDPRAQPYDERVARALADADPDALLGLDPALSAQLNVAGRAPWQVLAGAARAAGDRWRGNLSYHASPYGVAYFVATWERA